VPLLRVVVRGGFKVKKSDRPFALLAALLALLGIAGYIWMRSGT